MAKYIVEVETISTVLVEVEANGHFDAADKAQHEAILHATDRKVSRILSANAIGVALPKEVYIKAYGQP
jgi:hypothetical protein